MLKNICAISVFAILIYFFSVMGISLTGQDCIVAKNSSVGVFTTLKTTRLSTSLTRLAKAKLITLTTTILNT